MRKKVLEALRARTARMWTIFNESDTTTQRSGANEELMRILSEYLKQNPTQRFGQALWNLGIVRALRVPPDTYKFWNNEFYTESFEMLKRVRSIQDA